jgi:integrase
VAGTVERYVELSPIDQLTRWRRVEVPKSKTEAGTGRVVPLTSRVCAVLTIWLARLPEAKPEDFLFPRHSIGVAGNNRLPCAHNICPDQPMGSWKKAWRLACNRAEAHYRWHDTRNTFGVFDAGSADTHQPHAMANWLIATRCRASVPSKKNRSTRA